MIFDFVSRVEFFEVTVGTCGVCRLEGIDGKEKEACVIFDFVSRGHFSRVQPELTRSAGLK